MPPMVWTRVDLYQGLLIFFDTVGMLRKKCEGEKVDVGIP